MVHRKFSVQWFLLLFKTFGTLQLGAIVAATYGKGIYLLFNAGYILKNLGSYIRSKGVNEVRDT